jgi:hypothetical protein
MHTSTHVGMHSKLRLMHIHICVSVCVLMHRGGDDEDDEDLNDNAIVKFFRQVGWRMCVGCGGGGGGEGGMGGGVVGREECLQPDSGYG